MRYWWVNQNQTYRHEVDGGYLWSPKRKSNGQRNAFYEFMREVSPGDVVFSFRDTIIAAIGIARSFCYESPKPLEFGTAGTNWSTIGWKVEVTFQELTQRVRPKEHMDRLGGFLPPKYSPLTPGGDGLQSVYLTEIGTGFAAALFGLIGQEGNGVADSARTMAANELTNAAPEKGLDDWEKREESRISTDAQIAETERDALIQARRGQGQFRSNVRLIERACRVTHVERPEHLVASHIQPWRDSTNEERLAGENGLLLTPTIDHLFDKGFISFEGNGRLVISPVAHRESLQRMGIEVAKSINVGGFSDGQRKFLEYHRENVLRTAAAR